MLRKFFVRSGCRAVRLWRGVPSGGGQGTYNLNGGLLILSLFGLSEGSGTATFNFSGGTLKAGGGFSTSLPMTLGTSGGGATFDTAGHAVTLSGLLSGPGSLTKVDSGTLTLATANTYGGNTLVSGGTLALRNPFALQNSTLDTSGGGVLEFRYADRRDLRRPDGSGNLTFGNAASAAVALSTGNNNASTTFSGALQGAGSLTKIGIGIADPGPAPTPTPAHHGQPGHAASRRPDGQPGDGQ